MRVVAPVTRAVPVSVVAPVTASGDTTVMLGAVSWMLCAVTMSVLDTASQRRLLPALAP